MDGTLTSHPLNMTLTMTPATPPGSVQAHRDPRLHCQVGGDWTQQNYQLGDLKLNVFNMIFTSPECFLSPNCFMQVIVIDAFLH